ncbi:hypothetical protein HU200_065350 [Digitaria exilis]|uniref:Sialate O-acetylesterase domain-containing protein n=1 Tax=Digitaria exilis TaxID=1010633 RepID=A0A835A0D8_9POAL|nr:hypothetical protein HU200_065350 [Digitaria exilis]
MVYILEKRLGVSALMESFVVKRLYIFHEFSQRGERGSTERVGGDGDAPASAALPPPAPAPGGGTPLSRRADAGLHPGRAVQHERPRRRHERHLGRRGPTECAPSPRISRFSPALRWEEAREPLHAGIDVGNVLGVGPGMPFAHAVLAAAGGAPPPWGSSPARRAARPSPTGRGHELYERMVHGVQGPLWTGAVAAPSWPPCCGTRGDRCHEREDRSSTRGAMETLVRDVRRDLGRPDLLVIEVSD